MLGPVEVVHDGTSRPLGGRQPRLLLAVLAARRDQVLSRDHLVEVLWPERPPRTAVTTLQVLVSRLRRVLEVDPDGPVLESRGPGYRLVVPAGSLDAGEFERLVARGRAVSAAQPRDALLVLEQGEALWRGPAFAGMADREDVVTEATRLDELRLSARELALEARLACGRADEVVGVLDGLVAEHAWREPFWRLLVLALHRLGRTAEALDRARRFRTVLRTELGLDPSPAFADLETAVLRNDPSLRGPRPPADPVGRRPARSPPIALEPLVGRAATLAAIRVELGAHRLVTLTGTGGVGKTRLAEAIAVEQAVTRADGACVVALAQVRPGAAVASAVASALDLQRRPERSLADSIVDVLGDADLLLVLDNGEHVLDDVAALVRDVLPRCPGVVVLCTSREPLGLPAEVVCAIPPLGTPGSVAAPADEVRTAPAVMLFAQRAAAARPGFVVDDAALRAVAEICIRLDGVPLALELAAARLRSMGPDDLARRLDARFRLLGGLRGTDPRHRGLQDVVSWSYALLSPAEQELFARLGAFAGPFDLGRAEEVCSGGVLVRDDVAALLSALVDKSMVVADGTGGRMRYRLLETLREFARDRLGDSTGATTVRAAHARSHLRTARAAAAGLDGPDEQAHRQALAEDFDDLREAVDRSLVRGDLDTAVEVVVALREFCFRTVRYEILGWARAVADAPGGRRHPGRPVVAGMVAYGHFVRGDLSGAEAWARSAVDDARAAGGSTEGLAERVLGNVLFYRGRPDEALASMDRMLDVVRERGLDDRLVHASYMCSVARSSVGHRDAARRHAETARSVAGSGGSPTALAQAAYAEALVLEDGEPARAADLLDVAVGAASEAGNRWMHAFARTEQLALRARSGDLTGTLAGFREVVDTWFRGGDWANQWLSLRHLMMVFAGLGELTTAGLLHGAIEAAGATSALPFEPSTADRAAAVTAAARTHDPHRFDAAAARGRMTADDAVVRHVLGVLDEHLAGRDVTA